MRRRADSAPASPRARLRTAPEQIEILTDFFTISASTGRRCNAKPLHQRVVADHADRPGDALRPALNRFDRLAREDADALSPPAMRIRLAM